MSVGNVRGNWFCKWYDPGKKEHKEYFGKGDLARQQAILRDEQIKRDRGKLREPSCLSVTQICQAYHTQHPAEPSTLSSDWYRLKSVILPVLGHLPADMMTTTQINDYALKRLKDGRKQRTIDRELDLLRSAFNWAARQNPPLIARNPMAAYRYVFKSDSEVSMPPTVAEIQRILSHSPEHLVRGILVCWYAGLRPGGEVERISWQDVNTETWQIRVTSARKGGPSVRMVPICQALKDHVLPWKESDTRIGASWLLHYRGSQVHSLKKSWATAKRKAGITRRIRLYDLRHAFATYALEGGADLKALSEVMGHSRPETLMRHYQHVLDNMRREAVEFVPRLRVLTCPKMQPGKQ